MFSFRLVLIIALTIIINSFLYSNNNDSNPSDLMDLSIEELMKIDVKVSSVEAKNIFKTPSNVTIIDRTQILQYNYRSVAEALRTVAGFDIYYTVLDQNVPTSRGILQNFYANKVLVMINNIPTWQPIYGNTVLDRISINDVQRIEVLKGPASVLYGSNAYTGVINIILNSSISESHSESEVNTDITLGYPKAGTAGANIKFKEDDFNFFISGNAAYETKNPYKVDSKKGSTIFPADPYDSLYYYYQHYNSYNINLNLNYKTHTLFVNDFIYEHTFPGIDPSYKQGGGNQFNNQGTLINYTFKDNFIDDNLLFIASATYDYFKRSYPDNYDRTTALIFSGERIVGNIKSNYRVSKEFNFELGVDLEKRISNGHNVINVLKDSIVKSNLKNEKNIFEWSAFSQLNYSYSFLTILGGIRYTNNNLVGDNVSSRIAGLFKINDNNSIKLLWGQAFRTPQMLELFFDHPTVIGNLDLKPETSFSYELTYLTSFKNLFMQAIVYHSSYENLIQRVTPSTGPPSVYRNLSHFHAYGTEIEIKFNSDIINTIISYNFMTGNDNENASKENFKYVPNHTLRAGLQKDIGRYFASLNGYLCTETDGNLSKIPAQGFIDGQIGLTHNFNGNKAMLIHSFIFKNITSSEMLTPEYIRRTPNINALASMGYGMSIYYNLKLQF